MRERAIEIIGEQNAMELKKATFLQYGVRNRYVENSRNER